MLEIAQKWKNELKSKRSYMVHTIKSPKVIKHSYISGEYANFYYIANYYAGQVVFADILCTIPHMNLRPLLMLSQIISLHAYYYTKQLA